MQSHRRMWGCANCLACCVILAAWAGDGWAVEPTATVQGQIEIVGGDNAHPPDISRTVVFLGDHPDLLPADANVPAPQMKQHNKAFLPNLLVVSRGTTIEFPNMDPFSHNVFSRSTAARFDLDRYEQGMSKSYRFDNVGLVQLFCNIHPQMRAVILVVPNRHFAQADAQGRFQLSNVPPGKFSLVVWHEQTGAQQQTIQADPHDRSLIPITLTVRQVQTRSDTRRRANDGVARGLGIKREQLDLPVVENAHPAPPVR